MCDWGLISFGFKLEVLFCCISIVMKLLVCWWGNCLVNVYRIDQDFTWCKIGYWFCMQSAINGYFFCTVNIIYHLGMLLHSLECCYSPTVNSGLKRLKKKTYWLHNGNLYFFRLFNFGCRNFAGYLLAALNITFNINIERTEWCRFLL